MDKQGETGLARALLAGEADAFERFIEHFRSKVFHYSWLICGSPQDAEEVAQETLLKVFDNFDQLRDPERVRSWVFRIARNVCLMQRRRRLDVVKTRLHRGRAAMRQKLDCYINNHCLDDQPSPHPAPLTPGERADLYSAWRTRVA